jgi:hypothetical protein
VEFLTGVIFCYLLALGAEQMGPSAAQSLRYHCHGIYSFRACFDLGRESLGHQMIAGIGVLGVAGGAAIS